MTTAIQPKSPVRGALALEDLRTFVEHEASLLDEQRFGDWLALYADDGVYWVPARHGQESWLDHVSLFYDDKVTMRTRVQRLMHEQIHCQDPQSRCVRVVSGFRLEPVPGGDVSLYRVSSKFIMLEDRAGADRRFYGGRYVHTLRQRNDGLEIVQKRVELTNCDHSFAMLTQPF
jgi:benzoate/toluate 1,2-dioxygenase beta subunit